MRDGHRLPFRREPLARTLASLVILMAGAAVAAGPKDDTDEPPISGQPAGFNGAIGSYQISAQAEPKELQAEDPLIFTVRVTGSGRQPPRRFNLGKLPAFTKRFAIEDVPDPNPKPRPGVWEFRYRLKPLSAGVTEVPPLRFDYYKPGIIPREKGYRTAFTRSLPLTVKPRREVQAAEIQGAAEPSQIPEPIYHLAEDHAAILRHDQPFPFPGPILWLLLLLTPPAVCAGWYRLWQYLYPDVARQTRQRQSRAARQALHDLKALDHREDAGQAHRIAVIAADYFRQRWSLSAAEPTPGEVAVLLRRQGFSEFAEQAAELFRTCDVARFAPAGVGQDSNPVKDQDRIGILSHAAARLIRALEEQP